MSGQQIIHVDMDAFFASVEQRDDPSLRGKPVLVGGGPPRGVVAAASYEAREFGVRSAMPMVEAVRRCPRAIIVSPRGGRYGDVSKQIFDIFRRYTPDVEGLSVDEAFLDVTGSRALFGDGATIARAIKDAITTELSLTASAGVAPTKFVAKIASDLEKPDGLVVVTEGEVVSFLAPLPVERMWGVGPRAAAALRDRGYRTIGDLARAGPDRLERMLGSWGRTVAALARGEDARRVVSGRAAKSVGAEETFDVDIRVREELERRLLAQSARVADRLVASSLSGSVVTVKVKYADFTLKTRQMRLPEPVADTDSIYRAALELLGRFDALERGVRLTGVSVGDITDGPPPPVLFPEPDKERRQRLEETVHALRERFDGVALKRASLIEPADD